MNQVLRKAAIEHAKKDCIEEFGSSMANKELRKNLPTDLKKQIVDYLMKRGHYWYDYLTKHL